MPWSDWQFWTVTVIALWGAFTVGRQFVPRRDAKTPACGACASGSAACAKPTIRKAPDLVVLRPPPSVR